MAVGAHPMGWLLRLFRHACIWQHMGCFGADTTTVTHERRTKWCMLQCYLHRRSGNALLLYIHARLPPPFSEWH
eukprot:scaffold169243_cov20-Tisochrysis_lutea.AAC.2